MLPLLAPSAPLTASDFAAALDRGLREINVVPRGIAANGAPLAQLQSLRIDLAGATLNRELRPAQIASHEGQQLEIARFELSGAPIHFEGAPMDFRLLAEGVRARLDWVQERGSLVLESADGGEVAVEIAHEVLEATLHRVAVEAAAKQGFEIRKTSLQFTQQGPRGISFRAEVTAKVFIMSAKLALMGRVTIDDELTARVSGLTLDGDGMVLKMATGYAKPYLDRLDNRAFPLLAFSAGGLKIQDVTLTAGAKLQVNARLGSEKPPIT